MYLNYLHIKCFKTLPAIKDTIRVGYQYQNIDVKFHELGSLNCEHVRKCPYLPKCLGIKRVSVCSLLQNGSEIKHVEKCLRDN